MSHSARRHDAAIVRRVRVTGRRLLDQAIEASGGTLTVNEAPGVLGVAPETLQRWRDAGAVLELRAADRSARFPVGQFEPAGADGERRPFEAIKRIREVAGDALTVDELVGILASAQPGLDIGGRPRTGFQALADGAEVRGAHSLGLLGLRERAITLGGTVAVGTGPSGGTTVALRVPLANGSA